ncbi:unnamed protein product [Phytophthora fragariaefolia]|uniref:Unnamed protein product n=1 Tax=Phytophthora fragariaefolia TaxID=1490495 RepID=A0A9W6X9V0_9STRA|nr:unnamed protein product [Phytophthora fragariaefolia]
MSSFRKRSVSNCNDESPHPKKRKTAIPPDGHCPVLQSRLVVRYPLIVEAETMQVESLAMFELASSAETSPAPTSASQSTDASIIAIWSPRSVTVSNPPSDALSPCSNTLATLSYCPGSAQSKAVSCSPIPNSDPSTTAACPTRLNSSLPESPTTSEVPRWFVDAFESDGYDSEALELISHLSPPTQTVNHGNNQRQELFRETWAADKWPSDVERLSKQWNPHKWKFPPVSLGIRNGAGCGCETRYNAGSCLNAKESQFCSDQNCAFGGICGNSLGEHPSLMIARSSRTGMRGLVASAAITAGEVLGEYLGHVDLFAPPCRNGPPNEGFRMHLKTRPTGNKHVGIDALERGGLLRLMNHACDPTARFHEVQTGTHLTVVAVSVWDIEVGEEVTVSYRDRLWFVCRCGWIGCQHRDIQHLLDVPHYHDTL